MALTRSILVSSSRDVRSDGSNTSTYSSTRNTVRGNDHNNITQNDSNSTSDKAAVVNGTTRHQATMAQSNRGASTNSGKRVSSNSSHDERSKTDNHDSHMNVMEA